LRAECNARNPNRHNGEIDFEQRDQSDRPFPTTLGAPAASPISNDRYPLASTHFRLQPRVPRIAAQSGSSTPAIQIFMKILLAILGILLVAASLVADYKWRKWMADRRRDRQ
jgi:hypothetical protein